MYIYRIYNNLFWIFLLQMEYRLQSMYNHMVGRTASVVSPFYSILPGENRPNMLTANIYQNTVRTRKLWNRRIFIDLTYDFS